MRQEELLLEFVQIYMFPVFQLLIAYSLEDEWASILQLQGVNL
jgi:hypothetical protein